MIAKNPQSRSSNQIPKPNLFSNGIHFFSDYSQPMFLSALAAVIIFGKAWVIDGDTIVIRDTHIRLHGIDAPERKQTCFNGKWQEYDCGQVAKHALEDFVRGKVLECTKVTTDKYQRVVATCTVDGMDLNAAMVESGNAVAYRKYSKKYIPLEQAARKAKIGVWRGKFISPAKYRYDKQFAK